MGSASGQHLPDPAHHTCDASVDAKVVGPAAAQAPADQPRQEPAATGLPAHQGPSRVTLKGGKEGQGFIRLRVLPSRARPLTARSFLSDSKQVTSPFEASASPAAWPDLQQALAIVKRVGWGVLMPHLPLPPSGPLSTVSPQAKCLTVGKEQNYQGSLLIGGLQPGEVSQPPRASVSSSVKWAQPSPYCWEPVGLQQANVSRGPGPG